MFACNIEYRSVDSPCQACTHAICFQESFKLWASCWSLPADCGVPGQETWALDEHEFWQFATPSGWTHLPKEAKEGLLAVGRRRCVKTCCLATFWLGWACWCANVSIVRKSEYLHPSTMCVCLYWQSNVLYTLELHAINDHFDWCPLMLLFTSASTANLEPDICNVHTDFDRLLWSLGNLTLLEPGTNGSVGNKEYWEKCKSFLKRPTAFLGAGIVFNLQCEQGTLWTVQQCSERGEGMLRYAIYADLDHLWVLEVASLCLAKLWPWAVHTTIGSSTSSSFKAVFQNAWSFFIKTTGSDDCNQQAAMCCREMCELYGLTVVEVRTSMLSKLAQKAYYHCLHCGYKCRLMGCAMGCPIVKYNTVWLWNR